VAVSFSVGLGLGDGSAAAAAMMMPSYIPAPLPLSSIGVATAAFQVPLRARVCGMPAVLSGPSSAPHGAHVVTPSQNLPNLVASANPGTTFWLSRGVYTFGPGRYNQVEPQNGDVFIGAPGAVIDGKQVNYYAFGGQATHVTIEYLTIENFGTRGGNQNEGVVNHDSGDGWIMEHDTVSGNGGAGMMIGSNDVVEFNCLTQNGQYGFNAYGDNGVSNVVVSNNEISFNDTFGYDITRDTNCGCAGGGKFWETTGAVVTDNYVHDNQDPGLWVDTDNAGFNISGNYIAHNSAAGLIYEISYNALISHNTFVDNGWGEGPSQGLGFPTTALYISESGSDPRVNSAYNTSFNVVGNDFIDNWGGVVLWENANRFCSDGSDGVCTLVNPSVFTVSSCKAHLATSKASQIPDYYDGCRWKTQNVNVSDNTFQLTASHVPGCTTANGCGFNGVFSEYGSSAPFKGTAVEGHITFDQNNHFFKNTYIGPWSFMIHEQGTKVSWAKWRKAPYLEDLGSTLRS
jgi:hypothetical protein